MELNPQIKVDKLIIEFLLREPFPWKGNSNSVNIVRTELHELVQFIQKHFNIDIQDDEIFQEMNRIDCNHKGYLNVVMICGSNHFSFNVENATKWVSLRGETFLFKLHNKQHRRNQNRTMNTTYNFNGNNSTFNENSNIGHQNNNSNDITYNFSNFKNGIQKLSKCKDQMSDSDERQLSQLIKQLSLMYKSNDNRPGILKKFRKFISKTSPKIKIGLDMVLLAIEIKNQLMI